MDNNNSGVLMVTTTPRPGISDERFNKWYDEVHIPEILERVPGVGSVERFRCPPGEPEVRFLAIYRTTRPAAEVLEALRGAALSSSAEMLDMETHPPVVAPFDALG
ncbi:hypothetical protein QNO00_12685 [Arthrobacter sp. zg-Y1219]|uniref:hypothetical protein n=1 Tax=Arthrobacter sp. zg-Y1219 TaxID=3049067 RepID=UPI0024C4045D|nr:hypothetical protein [Arthrobacter sp. zg-Y1219]MDK1361116.1 hypothetical protein [Arthrobacter sp. zg-Y1219]